MDMMQAEIRYLLLVISAVLNQRETPALSSRQMILWKNLYRLADANRVANLVYVGLLGLGTDIGSEEKELFFERYQQELRNIPVFEEAQQALESGLERLRIPAVILEGCEMRSLYPHRELRKMEQIRILVQKGKLDQVAGLLRDLDYEPRENREDEGLLYYRIPGVYVRIYEKLQFANGKLDRYLDSPVWMFPKAEGRSYVRCFDREEAYLYRAGFLAKAYALGRADVLDVLDFWLYSRRYREELNGPYVEKLLAKFRLLEFSEQILKLAGVWFENTVSEQPKLHEAMENYIFSRGTKGREASRQILPLLSDVADFYRRDRRREWMQRKREVFFPNREYMETFFPVLKRLPWLLPVCWLIRLCRAGAGAAKRALKNARERVKSRYREFREKLQEKRKQRAEKRKEKRKERDKKDGRVES